MSEFLERFRPDMCAGSVGEIDVAALKLAGYEALMLDLDNTLLPWQSSEVPESSKNWIEQAKGLGMKLCIVSNTHNPRRLAKIAGELNIAFLPRALKPRAYGFEKAGKMLGCPLERAVVVGDQILTDILGGNLAGMHTILVRPMHRREFVGTKISRLIERGILALLGTNSGRDKSEVQDTK
ncbi:MAG: YqeG family HAD IIIA-type phosphatase [Armatimonadetes bacterium]|nr:YqeG family HAD IIIA-type phosphatase [Armatimonadota bacterium]